MPTPILATKLYVPAPRPKAVLRPRLIERLNEGLFAGRKLTLISAAAGFGKTTLVSEWVAGCGRPVAWLSLDAGDNDAARFLTYFIAALQTIVAEIGAGGLGALQSPQPPTTESILTALLNEITTLPGKFILVLDDYHVIDAKPVDDALIFLLQHLPPQMHLVLATREDPSLPLARLRARGQLTELRAADLRFTPAEAAEFLNRLMGLNLSAEGIAALEARTEGWIAGLQLAAISMQGHADTTDFIKSFTGSHHFVLDYLIEEVLQQQHEGVQAFLLRTSILDRMCGPLCEALLRAPAGSGQDTLAALERANLFIVPLDNERRWYRYHHLFGELLRKRLGQGLAPAEIAGLHLEASAWLESNGLAFEAFHHATAAGDVERAERLIEREEIGLHLRSVAVPVLGWLASLPKATKDARPSLWVRSATLALMAGQTAEVEARLQAAEAAFAAQGVWPGAELDAQIRDLFGRMACARATLAVTRYDPQTMIAQARRAQEYLRPENLISRFTASWALAVAQLQLGDRAAAAQACLDSIAISQQSGHVFSIILATANLARVQALENQLHLAAESYQRVLQLAGDHPQPNAGDTHLSLAHIHYEWNDLEAAERHGEQSLGLLRQFDRTIDRFIRAEVFLARLKLAQGDSSGADALLTQAEQGARQPGSARWASEVAAVRVLYLLQQNMLPAAAQLAQAHPLPLSQARVCLAQGDPSAALAILEPLRQQMEAKGWQDERLKALVLQAVALQAHGDKDEAVQTLGEALVLAEPGGFVRLFIDEGAPMARLLSEAAAHGMMPGYVGRLLAAFAAEGQPAQADSQASLPPRVGSASAQPLLEPLSPRELQVLRLMAQGLSNREICMRLFLALDTVKGHNRRIFAKLDVQRRTEAIARARELGLL